MTEAIVVHRDVSGPLEFSSEQQQMIRDTYARGASEAEFKVLLEIAKVRRLNPLLRQVHFVSRKDKKLNREVWAPQVSIDGLRAIADRTGLYAGQDEPEYELDKEGLILSCKVKVYRKDWGNRPAVGVAHWGEYVQTNYEGQPTKFWQTMPRVMLAKCAESIALRKAFPEDCGGIFTDEEMQQADNGSPDLHLSPHAAPDEDRHAADKASEEFNDIMGTLQTADRYAFDPACTWDQMYHWRCVIGTKGKPSELGKRLSALYHGESISPNQRKEMGALWNRVDRKLTQLEGKLKAPSVENEGVFVDEPDGTEALGAPEREPGDDADD